MELTREPNARAYLAAGNYMLQKSSTRATKLRVLLFALKYNNKSHYSTKHNHKLEQIRVYVADYELLSPEVKGPEDMVTESAAGTEKTSPIVRIIIRHRIRSLRR